MKRFCTLLLVLSLLLPGMSQAASMIKPEPSPAAVLSTDEKAIEMMNEAFGTADVMVRIALIREAVKTAPKNVEVLLGCAYLLFNSDPELAYYEECEKMLRDAVALAEDPARTAGLQMLTELLALAGRQSESIEILTAEIEKAPENEDLRISLATSYFYDQQNEAALAQLEELAEDSPRNLEALRLRGMILSDECMWEEALEAFRQIEAGWPEAGDGIYGQFLTYKASGQFTRAIRMLDSLLRMGVDDTMWVERARIRLWMLHQPEEALTEADALLRSNPDWVGALVVKLGALLTLERYGEIETVIDSIGKQDPALARVMRGILRMNEDRWEDAVDEYESLTEEVPEWYSGWLHLGMARLIGYNDAEGAMEAFAKAFALDGSYTDMDLFLQLGHAHRRLGDYQEAARAYLEADALTYEDPQALYFFGMVHVDAGNVDGLAETVTEMERRYPGWYETMLARVILEDVSGNADAALKAFNALKEKFPFPAAQLTALEGTLIAATGAEGGAAAIKAWLEADEKNVTPTNWDNYAYALLREGNPDAALEALKEAEALLAAEPEAEMETADARASIEMTRAAALLIKGDTEGCLAAIAKALEAGASPEMLATIVDFETLHENEAFKALVGDVSDAAEWDLSVPVTIPE